MTETAADEIYKIDEHRFIRDWELEIQSLTFRTENTFSFTII